MAHVGKAAGGVREAGCSQVMKVLNAGPRGPGSGFSPNPPSLRAPETASLASTVAQTVKNPPANAGDAGWIPGWGFPRLLFCVAYWVNTCNSMF